MTVTDVAGLTDVSSSTVTVLDTISPQITCPGDQIEVVDAKLRTVITRLHRCGSGRRKLRRLSYCTDPGSGHAVERPWYVQVVQLKVTDASGNADSCTFTVTLEDTTDPIAISQDTTVYLDGTGNGTDRQLVCRQWFK